MRFFFPLFVGTALFLVSANASYIAPTSLPEETLTAYLDAMTRSDWKVQAVLDDQQKAQSVQARYTFWFVVALLVVGAIGYGLVVGCFCRLLGHPRLLLGVFVVYSLQPWLVHHMTILRAIRDRLERTIGGSEELLFDVTFFGPAVVLCFALIVVVMTPRWWWFLSMSVPVVAFLTAWYATFPLAQRAVPSPLLDNMNNFWFAISSLGNAVLLLAYGLPSFRGRTTREERSSMGSETR